MKKKIQKPFNVEAAKNGAVVETKSGHSVRIVCYDKRSSYPILALVDNGDEEVDISYNVEGKYLYNRNDDDDLVIVEEVEVPKFKEGEIIVDPSFMRPWLIIAASSDYYMLQDAQGHEATIYHVTIDNLYRLWTLKDAKPGDILTYGNDNRPFIFKEFLGHAPVAYCGIDSIDSITVDTSRAWTYKPVRPATYKERQQFFNRLEEEGYKWDAESLTLSKIQKRWRDDERAQIDGYFINGMSQISFRPGYNTCCYNNLFATEKQAKAALAMARISQIMANDERFGGVVTNEEWSADTWRYVIIRVNNELMVNTRYAYEYLAFHTGDQARLFLKENEDLVKDYYMMD